MKQLIDQEAQLLAKLQRQEEQQFYRAHGRKPRSEDELGSWLSKEAAERARVQEANNREKRLHQEEAERRDQQLRLAIDGRLASRTNESTEYQPPQSVQDLEAFSADHRAFAERTYLRGNEKSPLRVDANLENFNLSRSQFEWVKFSSECNLRRVDFRGCQFEHVTFDSQCELSEANFDNSTFRATSFDPSAKYDGARFRFADFYDTNSIEFNRNYLSNTTFHRGRKDAWSKLSSAYAGVWQFINVALSAAFFGSVLFKLYLFEAVSRIQTYLLSHIPPQALSAADTREMSACTFLFGERMSSILVFLLFIVYQSLRFFVTTRVGPMIEMERQTGYTPSWADYDYMRRLNYIVTGLGYVVISVLIWDVANIFQLHVRIPNIRETGL